MGKILDLTLSNPNAIKAETTEQEHKVLEVLRQIDYGEMRIVVKDSEIVQIEEKKSIKL